MNTTEFTSQEQRILSAKVGGMQRELSSVVEKIYQQSVPFDDPFQKLIVQALDDIHELQAHISRHAG